MSPRTLQKIIAASGLHGWSTHVPPTPHMSPKSCLSNACSRHPLRAAWKCVLRSQLLPQLLILSIKIIQDIFRSTRALGQCLGTFKLQDCAGVTIAIASNHPISIKFNEFPHVRQDPPNTNTNHSNKQITSNIIRFGTSASWAQIWPIKLVPLLPSCSLPSRWGTCFGRWRRKVRPHQPTPWSESTNSRSSNGKKGKTVDVFPERKRK